MIDGPMDADLIDKLLPPLVMGVFATGFFALWWKHRQFGAAGLLALSYLSGCIAFTLEASYGVMAFDQPIPFLGDILYTLCAAIFAASVIVRYGHRPNVPVLVALVVVATCAHSYFRFYDPELLTRMRILAVAGAIGTLLPLGVLWKNRHLTSARFLAGQIVVLALALVLSSTVALAPFDNTVSAAVIRESLYMSLLNMIVTVASLTVAMTLYISFVSEVIERLKSQSETDPLTGLLNRRGFEAHAEILFESYGGRPLVMIVGDIDHFKRINDVHGHSAGDDVLRQFGTIIRGGVRNSDLCGRIGGEEFCLILPGADLRVGQLCAENLRSVFSQTARSVVDAKAVITASFGVGEWRPGDSYQSLFERADAALYDAKNKGRNCVCTTQNATRPTLVQSAPKRA